MGRSAVSFESRHCLLEKAGFGDPGCSFPCDTLPEATDQMCGGNDQENGSKIL